MTALARTLSARDVLVLTLSALSPAASVYITGSNILRIAGTGAAAAVLVGGLVITIASLLYAELGSAFPEAGGIYPGITRVLGPGTGFAAIALLLITAPAALAFGALGLADYLRVLDPALPKLPLALGALAAAALLSVLNIRTSAWITGAFLAAEMVVVLLLAAAAGLSSTRSLSEVLLHPVMVGPGNALVATPPWTMLLATISGAYACAGSSLAIYFSEDFRGVPSRIGRIVVIGGAIATTVISIPLVLVTTSVRDLAGTLSSEAPIARLLAGTVGPTLATATALIVALAIFNNIIAHSLASSRLLYSTGRDGIWRAGIGNRLAALHRRFGSPWLACAVLGLAAAGFCGIGERRLLILLSGEIFTSAMVVVAVGVGRVRGLTGVSTFRSPLFPMGPLVGLGIIAAFVTADWHDPDAGRPSLILLAAVAVAAFSYFRIFGVRRRS